MQKFIILPILLVTTLVVSAQLRLPAILDDHMVLQRETRVPIWGWAHPDQEILIQTSWDTTTVKTRAKNTTLWKAEIKTPVAGGPHTVTIRAGNEVRTLTDVMSGEVWICSGQSNMEWGMDVAEDGKDLIPAINDRNIRLIHVPKSGASTRQARGEGDWRVCDAASVEHFSAVAYFFGKKLTTELNVPIGLINVSWGGTNAELWVPKEVIEKDAALMAAVEKQTERPWWPHEVGSVFNAMINPILPYKIAGTIWYQGEANTVAPLTYKKLMETLIMEWRNEFKTNFPFYYVQIAPFAGYDAGQNSMLLREQQVKMLTIPKTGMVVISDHVDNINDIHPVYKKPVGDRLADLALADTYGIKGVVYQYPLYQSMKVEKDKIRITFSQATKLVSKGAITGFTIAGNDRKFYPANAKIEGDTVVVWAKEVKTPAAVRFAWGNDLIPNLFSQEGLPVSVFRTDDWD